MSKIKSVCRVCGKPYEVCSSKRIGTSYRWQEVSCSPECGMIYLERIIQSRSPLLSEYETKPVQVAEETTENKETPLFTQEEILEDEVVETLNQDISDTDFEEMIDEE